MSTNKYTRKHYHISTKAAGPVFADSSYELRAAILLDQDPEVLVYQDHQYFISDEGQTRIYDYLVTYKNGDRKLIEIKPKTRIKEFEKQIKDNRIHAEKNGWLFEIWTEQELGFEDSKQITKWADDHIKERTGIDYSVVRKKKSCMKVKRHYRTHIANDKVTLFCSFCNKEHTPLRLTHDKNIARNGRYICEREGGKIAGSRPKPHLRKDNPHAADGKKECISCLQILEFKLFSPDNTKSDGLCRSCKTCRSTKAKEKYKNKTK
jgi:hypothetical protein